MSQSMGDTLRKMLQIMSQKTGVLLQHDCLAVIGQRESGHSRKTSQVRVCVLNMEETPERTSVAATRVQAI